MLFEPFAFSKVLVRSMKIVEITQNAIIASEPEILETQSKNGKKLDEKSFRLFVMILVEMGTREEREVVT